VVNIVSCDNCGGTGTVVSNRCSSCGGDGRLNRSTTLSIDIPAGVSTGNYIPLHGQGDAGPNNGPAGDVIVIIEELEHEIFERHGLDLLCHLPISFWQAALGDTVVLETLDGKVKLNIPPGTQSHKLLRLRNKGLPEIHGRDTGDILVKIIVDTPEKLSSAERKLFEQIKEIQGPKKNRPRSFFNRARDRFGL
jgi:molecular chaperone DnaJ